MGRSRRWIAAALAGTLAGCVSSADKGGGSNGKGAVKSLSPDEVVTAQASAALTRATSCSDLLSRIQNDVASKIVLQAELLKLGQQPGSNHGGVVGVGVATPGFANTGAASMAAPVPGTAPVSGSPSSSDKSASTPSGGVGTAPPVAQGTRTSATDSSASSGPSGHSDTNVQVKGVDEADIVKTDGKHIYLLHGNRLLELKSWPANETAIEGQGIAIEGSAIEMFVQDGTAVVFSSVYDQGDLIDATASQDKASPEGISRYYGSPFTKITLIDMSSDTPKTTRELLLEGNYLSSRRYDNTVRAVIQGGFRTPSIYAANIEYQDPWGRTYPQAEIDQQADEWRDRMLAAIASTKLEDWVPAEREIVDGQLSKPSRRCTDFYAPTPGLTDYGLTNIVSFDLSDPKSALSGALVLGAADEVYSNEAAMLLAHRDYRWDEGLIERERTVLHRFELKGAATSYSASGSVPGQIVDQFSLDELDGVVRVATTSRLWPNFRAPIPALAAMVNKQDDVSKDSNGVVTLARTTDNRVATLRAKGDALLRIGITDPLGDDGETLKSSRFVGDRGYVVTFHQRDPLMVIDLKQPEDPTLLGELDIPGFSDYMHPLDDNHLLTIGRDADPTTGVDMGLMLQIFDVSDATAPRRTKSFKFGPNGYSEANANHKAFTFYKPEGAVGYDGLLAFPYVNYSSQFQSTLQVLKVSAQDGFTLLGAIDHTQVLQYVCGVPNAGPSGGVPVYYFNQCVQPEVRRGLFVNGDSGVFVYSISYGGVLAHDLSDLARPVATVQLPLPDYSDHRVCYGSTQTCSGTAKGGGSVGFATDGVALPPAMTTPASAPTPAPNPEPMAGAGGAGGAGAGL